MIDRLFNYVLPRVFKKLRRSAVLYSQVHPTSKLESGTSFVHSTMARHSFCGYDCEIEHTDIGSFVSIANRVVLGGGKHPMNWVGMSPAFYAGRDSVAFKASTHKRPQPSRIMVGHDVWIGHSAIIMQGVQIGNGAVIGAGSIVTRDVPAYAVVAGNPARLLRYRFDSKTVHRLLKCKWWELPEADLVAMGDKIVDVEAFLDASENARNLGETSLEYHSKSRGS